MNDPDYLLSASAYRELIALCRHAAPEEACGIAAAAADDPRGIVTRVLPLRNSHPDPRRHYRLDPAEWVAMHYRLVRSALRPVAVYHSHPYGPSEPSEEDRRSAFWTGAPRAKEPFGLAEGPGMWIVSLENEASPELSAYAAGPDGLQRSVLAQISV
ncbi:M67 family metallopeptidase [Paenibacillus albicereus]|uniref:M67 family metallopeptidase n=1 Tax=Paenibacillus albicereus TaxID=2726185 RepID=A0A6H2GWQ0_9BACL|nr:M67 family metallopeptidase [Paenibacillus albicereus]QJC51596.1 M67 family metallopeptidase [Paenibacillus albicereus]